MLGSHSQIYTHPEPHLITPLAYLGYHATVDKAPYDHINGAEAIRAFVGRLPRGEADYLDALRAYTDTMYGRMLEPSGRRYFLDKTPAYALILPFLVKLYPRAKYIVLTRHPLAILHSVAHSFFAGDYEAAADSGPVLQRYVPAIGSFMREQPVPFVHVRYDDLVTEPAAQMQRIFAHLGVAFEPEAVTYGQHRHISKSYGDPMSVERHVQPVGDSLDKWTQDLLARPEAMNIAKQSVAALDADHLAAWGYPKDALFAAVVGKTPTRTRTPLNAYRFKRQLLLRLRRNIQHNAFGRLVKKIRYYCDVLLRT